MATETKTRPAFYALASGGWRDYLTLLHAPYTAWHLSYVAIGAALSAEFSWSRVVPALAAFFLAVGIGAHALDELRAGRCKRAYPLRPGCARGPLHRGRRRDRARGRGDGRPVDRSLRRGGAFIVVAYNLELFGGRFHGDFWFALAWGAFRS